MAPTPSTSKRPRRRRRPLSQSARLKKLRDEFWPDCDGLVWDRHKNEGFTTVPRLLSLILVLIKQLAGKRGDPSRAYLDLWLRARDEGFINVIEDEDFAYSSGYAGTRALRTWRERIFVLKEIGFIDIKPRGNTDIGYILLWNPLQVAVDLNVQGRVEEEWWNAFQGRATEIGATLPRPTAKKSRRRTQQSARIERS